MRRSWRVFCRRLTVLPAWATQPWRFIRVRSAALRSQMLALVEAERLETAKALGERTCRHWCSKTAGVDPLPITLNRAALCARARHHHDNHATAPLGPVRRHDASNLRTALPCEKVPLGNH